MTDADEKACISATYALDAGFAECTLVSCYSLLRHASLPVRVNILLSEPVDTFEADIRALFAAFSGAKVDIRVLAHDLPPSDSRKHISGATMLRLMLARYVDKRTIYIDGDTLIRHDLAPLAKLDLGGNCVAACVGSSALRNARALSSGNPLYWRPSRFRQKRYFESLGLEPETYFNAGLMIMDLPRIRDEGRADAMADIKTAARYDARDQDHLNVLFRERVLFLDPIWNALWGNPNMGGRPLSDADIANFAPSMVDPAVVHYVGPVKPWLSPDAQLRKKGWRWAQEWRDYSRDMSKLLGRGP